MKNIIAISILLTLASCHKERVTLPRDQEKTTTNLANGMGGDLNSLNSYLSLTEMRTSKSIPEPNPPKNKSIIAYAVFRDPGLPLTKTFDRLNQAPVLNDPELSAGRVSIGDLYTGPTLLNHDGAYFGYNGVVILSDTLSFPPHWAAEGNKTFNGFNLEIPRGYPQITDSLVLRDTVYAASGYTMNVSQWVTNFDSIIVEISNLGFSNKIVRRGTPGDASFVFSVTEVMYIWGSSGTPECSVIAYNYMNRKQNDKNLLFETGSRLRFRPVFKP